MEQDTPLDGFSRSAAEGIPQLACSLPYSKETGTDTNSVKRIVIYFTAQYFCFLCLLFGATAPSGPAPPHSRGF
jgi:hypothetical protein